jgi:hypothetical protein
MELRIELSGLKPMLQHNGRLANPLDPYTQVVKSLAAKRKKTDEDLASLLSAEARAAAYETHDSLLGLPTGNVWASIYNAATAYRRGADIKRALSYQDIIEPVLVDGESVDVEVFLKGIGKVDIRPVAVARAKTLRARPIVHNWSTVHHFDLMEDVIDVRDLVPILGRAGRLVGVGDWRPTYGTFDARLI